MFFFNGIKWILLTFLQVFQFRVDQENRVHNMFNQELIPQMFSNIKSLFKLHHDFLLPQLEERIRQWEVEDQGPEQRRIGDELLVGKVARARHTASCELLSAAHIEHERCGRRSARGEFGAWPRQNAALLCCRLQQHSSCRRPQFWP